MYLRIIRALPIASPSFDTLKPESYIPIGAQRPTQRSLEARLRNARYLAELTKLRLAPAGAFIRPAEGLPEQVPG